MEPQWHARGEVSLLSVGAALLRQRWRVIRWALLGGVIASLLVFSARPMYVASAAFVSQSSEANASDKLANIAGQFGFTLNTGTYSLSPALYASLLQSPTLLKAVARDTFLVHERGDSLIAFADLFQIRDSVPARREAAGVRILTRIINASVSRTTGVVELTLATEWPSVSLAIVDSLIAGINEFNRGTRHDQAVAERKFLEGRLDLARTELRTAEGDLFQFRRTNRQFGDASELTFERERLERNLSFKQDVLTSLTKSLEEAMLREVRDTPAITLIERPAVAALPKPRGRLKMAIVGLVIGALAGAGIAVASDALRRRRAQGGPETEEFLRSLADATTDLGRPLRWLRKGDSR